MAEKSPAFQWYPKDVLTDTKYLLMNWEQRGIYRHLLDLQWIDGYLPVTPDDIGLILGYPGERFLSLVWPRIEDAFPVNEDGKRRNLKMEEIRQKQDEYREKQAKLSKLSWKKRIQTKASHKLANGKLEADVGIGQLMPARGNALQSSSSSSLKENQEKKSDFGFTEEQNQAILVEIAKARGWGTFAPATHHAFQDLILRMKKQKIIDNPYAYALDSARNEGKPFSIQKPEESTA